MKKAARAHSALIRNRQFRARIARKECDHFNEVGRKVFFFTFSHLSTLLDRKWTQKKLSAKDFDISIYIVMYFYCAHVNFYLKCSYNFWRTFVFVHEHT